MSIKRYLLAKGENYGKIFLHEDDCGDGVLLSDYAALEARCAGLERERDAAVAAKEAAEGALRDLDTLFEFAMDPTTDAFVVNATGNEYLRKAFAKAAAILAGHAPATPMLDQLEAAPQPIPDPAPAPSDHPATATVSAKVDHLEASLMGFLASIAFKEYEENFTSLREYAQDAWATIHEARAALAAEEVKS